jgi:hypothetical protein
MGSLVSLGLAVLPFLAWDGLLPLSAGDIEGVAQAFGNATGAGIATGLSPVA